MPRGRPKKALEDRRRDGLEVCCIDVMEKRGVLWFSVLGSRGLCRGGEVEVVKKDRFKLLRQEKCPADHERHAHKQSRGVEAKDREMGA